MCEAFLECRAIFPNLKGLQLAVELCSGFRAHPVDTSHVGLLVPGSLRSEPVAVEDDVLLSFSSSRHEATKVIKLVVDVAMLTDGDEMILTVPY